MKNPAKIPTAQYLMMSMLSSLTLQTALKLWKPDSPLLKNLLQEIALLGKNELHKINAAAQKYHSATIENKKISGTLVFQQNSAKLYNITTDGHPTLIIPSFINKPHILDLNESKSFYRTLSENGLNPFLLDWGTPSKIEEDYNLEDYINEILIPSIEHISLKYGKLSVIGYCMGGFIATAAACLRPDLISKLVTIATPWDFKFFKKPSTNLISYYTENFDRIPKEIIQQLFYFASPYHINRKFINFNNEKIEAKEFIEIEDWVNDSVDMSKKVFHECFEKIATQNYLANNMWKINNTIISPSRLDIPIMSAIFKKDSIVPFQSAMSFVKECKNVNLLQLDSGHISAIINPKHNLAYNISKWLSND